MALAVAATSRIVACNRAAASGLEDDLFSAAFEGLVLAARSWDEGHGVSWAAYATIVVSRHVLRELTLMRHGVRGPKYTASKKRPPAVAWLDEPLRDGGRRQQPSSWPTPEDALMRKEAHEIAHHTLDGLGARDREVLTAHYGTNGDEPRSFTGIARQRGWSPQLARYTVHAALRRARTVAETGEAVSREIDDGMYSLMGEIGVKRHRAAAVQRFIAELPDKDRAIVEQRHGIGCEPRTFEVIAAGYGQARQAANSRYHRVIKRLRDKLGCQ